MSTSRADASMPHDRAAARSALILAARARARDALASGALEPIPTRCEHVAEAGVDFQVRVMGPRDPKRASASAAAARSNPFAPYERALFVADVPPNHVCLLNKYPAFEDHLLLVTRDFEAQQTPLSARDFAALWACMTQVDALGFYNSGPVAGASQAHRHLQLVPLPLGAGPLPTPIDPLLAEARFDAGLGRLARLPVLHAFARLRDFALRAPSEAARALHALYCAMLRAFGAEGGEHPYNLLLTREWMLLVPRTHESWLGIPVNALAYAGALLVRDEAQLEALRRTGPMQVLRGAGIARNGAPRTQC
jgi:sulfate adenylyltransferase (ADP) / ATP adenylyltransferase